MKCRAANGIHSKTHSKSDIYKPLSYIPADDRETWISVGMVLKSEFGVSGYPVFDEWSQTSEKYTSKAVRDAWMSFTGSGRTLGTLVHLARQNGWNGCVSQTNIAMPTQPKLQKVVGNRPKAVRLAREIWASGTAPDPTHAYLQTKNVNGEGIRQKNGTLLLPLHDKSANLQNLQLIYPTGKKRFLRNGQVKGCFLEISGNDQLIVCEGWATGKTLNELLGARVFCAMASFNLAPVARLVKTRHSDLPLRIAADNDRFTEGNPGIKAAKAAARSLHCEVMIPRFDEDQWGTDFNDLWVQAGDKSKIYY